jgi:hypothetical protein
MQWYRNEVSLLAIIMGHYSYPSRFPCLYLMVKVSVMNEGGAKIELI